MYILVTKYRSIVVLSFHHTDHQNLSRFPLLKAIPFQTHPPPSANPRLPLPTHS